MDAFFLFLNIYAVNNHNVFISGLKYSLRLPEILQDSIA